MKEHPNRQPGGAITVHRRDDDDGGTDQDFESYWIDVGASLIETLFVQSNSAWPQESGPPLIQTGLQPGHASHEEAAEAF
jgi:hypothetical protein